MLVEIYWPLYCIRQGIFKKTSLNRYTPSNCNCKKDWSGSYSLRSSARERRRILYVRLLNRNLEYDKDEEGEEIQPVQ